MNKFKELRLEKGLTQVALAQKLDIFVHVLRRIERNAKKCKTSHLIKYAVFFDVPTDYIMETTNCRIPHKRVWE